MAAVLAALLAAMTLAMPALVMRTMDGYQNHVIVESKSPDYDWITQQDRKNGYR
jgi:hypothetical protein